MPPKVWTIGHSTRTLEMFLEILKGARCTFLIDVRTIPRSRHNPQFNRETLPAALGAAGIRYRHEPALGGLRKPTPDSINGAWRNAGFRGFADHMLTPEFAAALDALVETLASERAVLMCAEAVPWRCHRSLIGDALTARGVDVLHLLGAGREERHELTPFARVDGTRVTYPALV